MTHTHTHTIGARLSGAASLPSPCNRGPPPDAGPGHRPIPRFTFTNLTTISIEPLLEGDLTPSKRTCGSYRCSPRRYGRAVRKPRIPTGVSMTKLFHG